MAMHGDTLKRMIKKCGTCAHSDKSHLPEPEYWLCDKGGRHPLKEFYAECKDYEPQTLTKYTVSAHIVMIEWVEIEAKNKKEAEVLYVKPKEGESRKINRIEITAEESGDE